MIVRAIKEHPEEVIKNFDFFNDYKDTMRWVKIVCPEIMPMLDKAYREWLKKVTTKKKRRAKLTYLCLKRLWA